MKLEIWAITYKSQGSLQPPLLSLAFYLTVPRNTSHSQVYLSGGKYGRYKVQPRMSGPLCIITVPLEVTIIDSVSLTPLGGGKRFFPVIIR